MFVHGPEGMGRASLISEFYHEDWDAFGRVYIEVAARQADGTMVPPGEMLGQAIPPGHQDRPSQSVPDDLGLKGRGQAQGGCGGVSAFDESPWSRAAAMAVTMLW
jgi:hypothetical protein